MTKSIKGRFLVLALAAPLLASSARANIYATDIKAANAASGVINITYILNEPATLGVTIQITSGTNAIRSLTAAPGTSGTLFGRNLMVWDGHDSSGFPVPTGNYTVSVTAAANGHRIWTQLSHDSNAGNHVFDPRGLAVNNNSNSPYYGRVFVGNAGTGPNYATLPGDQDTILKLNADGTFADEGASGNGGYNIEDLGVHGVPQKMRVGEDDRLYMMDLNNYSQLAAFDMVLSSNEIVLSPNNYSANPFWTDGSLPQGTGWFSMDVTGADTTNGLIWLGQADAGGAGIWNWHLTNGVADPNDNTGNAAVAVGGSLGVAASGGLMVASNFDIFAGQYLTDAGDAHADCMVFTNWNGGRSFGGAAVTNGAAWSAGGSDNSFLGVYDTTIDSRQHPKYVACALNGGPVTGGIRILNASNGAVLVTNLDATNQYYVTAWDNVGNLYAASGTSHLLRVFSPPGGTNQATTSASLQIAPGLLGITLRGAALTFTFSGAKSDTAGQITLQSCATVNGVYVAVPGAVAVQVSPGVFTVSATASAIAQFYRISQAGAH